MSPGLQLLDEVGARLRLVQPGSFSFASPGIRPATPEATNLKLRTVVRVIKLSSAAAPAVQLRPLTQLSTAPMRV